MVKKVQHRIEIYGDLSISLSMNHKWVKQLLSSLSHTDKEQLRSIYLDRITRTKLSIKTKTRSRDDVDLSTKTGIGRTMSSIKVSDILLRAVNLILFMFKVLMMILSQFILAVVVMIKLFC